MQTQKSTIPDTASLPNAPARGECPSQLEVSVRVGCSDFFSSNGNRNAELPQMQLRRQVCQPPARAVAERFFKFPAATVLSMRAEREVWPLSVGIRVRRRRRVESAH